MASLNDLIAQKEALEREIEKTRESDRSEAIAKVRSLMAEYGLNASDLAGTKHTRRGSGKGGKVAAKYRDRATGETWSGRGLQPKWLKAALAHGRSLSDFTV